MFTITKNVDITNSDKGSIWKQLLMSFFASLPFFTHGIQTASLSSSAHSGHFIFTPDEVPWSTTALILAAAASAPIYCYVIDRLGRKCGIYVVSLVQGASLIPLFLTQNEVNNLILHTFSGVSSGGLFTILPIYVREISADSLRGLTMSLMMLMTTAGYLMKLVISGEEMMYLMVALVAAQLIAILIILESPSYLVMAGKVEQAKTNLGKLICLSEHNPTVEKEVAILVNESERARANGRLTLFCILKKNKIYRDAAKLGFVFYTITVLCGSIVFMDQDKTLMQLKMNFDPEKTLVIGSLCAGSFICVMLIRFVDRKYLLATAYSIMTLSIGVLAVYTQSDLTVTTYRWVPIVCLGILVFAYGIVWALPNIIMTEVFNLEIRATMIGALFTYFQIIKLAHVHTFKYIEDYMGTHTLFYIFACIDLFGAVYSLFHVPEIKNKTVRQIERQLKRIPLIKL